MTTELNLASAPQVRKLLAEYDLHPKKRLGQNFLIDRNVLNRIVEASGAGPGTNILEIGPGLGAVTLGLAQTGARVVAVEADRTLLPILETVIEGQENVEIVIQDFLELDLQSFLAEKSHDRWNVVGNLPYYITSPIIAKLLDSKQLIESILIMVQREVAQRLKAQPGTDDYSSLTVFVQYHCDIESVIRVSRNVFYPVPEVDSEVVKLRVREQPRAEVANEQLFFSIVKAAFGKRRKTLHNALSSSPELLWDKARTREVLEKAEIDASRRGETLSIEEFARLANSAVENQ